MTRDANYDMSEVNVDNLSSLSGEGSYDRRKRFKSSLSLSDNEGSEPMLPKAIGNSKSVRVSQAPSARQSGGMKSSGMKSSGVNTFAYAHVDKFN